MGLFSKSTPASHFPSVQGRRLDGTTLSVPDDLGAEATLLIVSFRDELDPLADQWARLGDRLAEAHDGRVATVEAPVVNEKLKMFGKLSTLGIRGQVDGKAERDRTIPLYVDVKAFRKSLGLKDTGDVYAFLVAGDGRIVWRGEGDIDMDEVEELEAAIREVLNAADDSNPDAPPADDSDSVDAEASLSDAGSPDALGDEPPPVGRRG